MHQCGVMGALSYQPGLVAAEGVQGMGLAPVDEAEGKRIVAFKGILARCLVELAHHHFVSEFKKRPAIGISGQDGPVGVFVDASRRVFSDLGEWNSRSLGQDVEQLVGGGSLLHVQRNESPRWIPGQSQYSEIELQIESHRPPEVVEDFPVLKEFGSLGWIDQGFAVGRVGERVAPPGRVAFEFFEVIGQRRNFRHQLGREDVVGVARGLVQLRIENDQEVEGVQGLPGLDLVRPGHERVAPETDQRADLPLPLEQDFVRQGRGR